MMVIWDFFPAASVSPILFHLLFNFFSAECIRSPLRVHLNLWVHFSSSLFGSLLGSVIGAPYQCSLSGFLIRIPYQGSLSGFFIWVPYPCSLFGSLVKVSYLAPYPWTLIGFRFLSKSVSGFCLLYHLCLSWRLKGFSVLFIYMVALFFLPIVLFKFLHILLPYFLDF